MIEIQHTNYWNIGDYNDNTLCVGQNQGIFVFLERQHTKYWNIGNYSDETPCVRQNRGIFIFLAYLKKLFTFIFDGFHAKFIKIKIKIKKTLFGGDFSSQT